MPAWDRERVYRRLYDVLSGKDTSHELREAVGGRSSQLLEILRATKPGLPDYLNAASFTSGVRCRSLTVAVR